MKTRATKVRSTYRKSIKQYVQIFHVIIHKYIVLSVFYCFGFERNVIIYVYPAQNLHDYTCHGRSSLFYYYFFFFLGGGAVSYAYDYVYTYTAVQLYGHSKYYVLFNSLNAVQVWLAISYLFSGNSGFLMMYMVTLIKGDTY